MLCEEKGYKTKWALANVKKKHFYGFINKLKNSYSMIKSRIIVRKQEREDSSNILGNNPPLAIC